MPSYGEQSLLAYQTAAVFDEELLLQGHGQDEPTEGHAYAGVGGWAALHGFPVRKQLCWTREAGSPEGRAS